jgi:hypothetical protein
MIRRTLDDWKVLVDKQIASGMSVPKFCQQHDLSPKYFYGGKSIFQNAEPQADFIQVHVLSNQNSLINEQPSSTITLKIAAGELSLPGNTSASFLAALLNGLAS